MRYIKYGEISKDIKKEVEKYYEEEKNNIKNLTLEDAMSRWFDEKFQGWIVNHLNVDVKTRGDRRKSERRRLERRSDFRRKDPRFEIELPIKIVQPLSRPSSDYKYTESLGTIHNISGGGIYFRSKEPVDVSSMVDVIVDLSDVDAELDKVEASAIVVRVEKLISGDYGISVMFSSVKDEHQENFNLFLFKKLALQQSELYRLF